MLNFPRIWFWQFLQITPHVLEAMYSITLKLSHNPPNHHIKEAIHEPHRSHWTIEPSLYEIMPHWLKKAVTLGRSGVDDGLTALLLIALNDTHTNNQRMNPRRAARKSNVARTKNKSPLMSPPQPRGWQKKMPTRGIDRGGPRETKNHYSLVKGVLDIQYPTIIHGQ